MFKRETRIGSAAARRARLPTRQFLLPQDFTYSCLVSATIDRILMFRGFEFTGVNFAAQTRDYVNSGTAFALSFYFPCGIITFSTALIGGAVLARVRYFPCGFSFRSRARWHHHALTRQVFFRFHGNLLRKRLQLYQA